MKESKNKPESLKVCLPTVTTTTHDINFYYVISSKGFVYVAAISIYYAITSLYNIPDTEGGWADILKDETLCIEELTYNEIVELELRDYGYHGSGEIIDIIAVVDEMMISENAPCCIIKSSEYL